MLPLACGFGELLDALAGADRKHAAGFGTRADITVRHAAVEVDGIAGAERKRRVQIRMKLHRSAQDIEIFFAPVANETAKLFDASSLHVDDDRNHHFPE